MGLKINETLSTLDGGIIEIGSIVKFDASIYSGDL